MSIDVGQLVDYVIKPALKQICLYSNSSERLILGTCSQESSMGTYLHQVGGGAVGIFQMDPKIYWNMWNQFLVNKNDLKKLILSANGYSVIPHENAMITNMLYAAMMCRVRYLWVNEALPQFNDLEGQAKYWAKYYNGNPIIGRPDKYIENYHKHVGNYYEK